MSITFQSTLSRQNPRMSLLRRVAVLVAGFAERRRITSQHRRVEHLSDHLLRDIGLRREYGPNGWDRGRMTRD